MFSVFIYVAYCKGHAKIGLTEHPRRRIQGMQSGCPFPIELLTAIPLTKADAMAAEKAALLALSEFHWSADWFKCPKSAALHAVFTVTKDLPAGDGSLKTTKITRARGGWKKKPIITPHGNFDSLVEAAKYLSVTSQAVQSKLKRKISGWAYR